MKLNSNVVRTALMFLLVLVAGTSPSLAQHGQGRGAASKPPHPTTPVTKQSPTTPPTKPTTPLTPQEHLTAQPKLAAKLQTLIPGTPVNVAAQGFGTFGQFVAAVHVSHNLGIPFADLKVRLTGPNPESLGQSIHALRPTANADAAANLAEQQAKRDLKDKS